MNKIPIFLASDENYAPFLAATAYSVLKNTNSFIEFYILDGGISKTSKDLIKASLDKYDNFSINYIDMSTYDFSKFPNLRHYSLNTFSRYFIPDILPEAEKIIYLDVDIIVKRDIKDLFEISLDDYPLAAVLEDFYEYNAQYLKKEIYPEYNGGTRYFNAGVLVMNIQKFIQHRYAEKLIDMTIKYMDKLSTADQDIFNIVFENNFKVLDYKYNFMPDYYDKLAAYRPEIANTIKDDAYILHYTWYKPWKSNKTAAFSDFWQIAEKTLFADRIREVYNKARIARLKKVALFGVIPLPKNLFFATINDNDFNSGIIKKKTYKNNKNKFFIFNIPLLKIKYEPD